MSDEDEQTRAITRWEDSGVPVETVGMARAMVASGYFKNVTSVAQAIVKIELGNALGATPVEALQYLHIFTTQGDRTNIQLGYPLVGAMIQRSGKYHFSVKQRDEQRCEIDFYRILPSGQMIMLGTSRFTLERAKSVGLVSKEVWKQYPEIMLYARALTHGARTFCPEILGGADIATEEAYIERPVQHLEEGQAPVIEEPPGGFTDPWTRFWTFAKSAQPEGLGMTEDQVHDFFGVASLKESALNIIQISGKTEAEVVAEFELTLREAHAEPQRDPDEVPRGFKDGGIGEPRRSQAPLREGEHPATQEPEAGGTP